jgi:hypothetical protein
VTDVLPVCNKMINIKAGIPVEIFEREELKTRIYGHGEWDKNRHIFRQK